MQRLFSLHGRESISDLDAAPYGGARYPVESRLDGRIFVGFHIDVGSGDAVIEPVEIIKGRNWLEFAGIDSPSLYMIPPEQQFAEKLHAYTLPRPGAVNSRVRDLVDMVLLIQSGTLRTPVVSDAVQITFQRRKTHDLPKALAQPPANWKRPFSALAKECGLIEDINSGFTALRNFLAQGGIVGNASSAVLIKR